MPPKLIILDVDGVLLDEMPYFCTALAMALDWHDLAPRAQSAWERLSRACLIDQRLQCWTKGRGCNSNWDLAAVLTAILDDAALRDTCRQRLATGDVATIARRLAASMDARWQPGGDVVDPLQRYGIERNSAFFDAVVGRFQSVYHGTRQVGWDFERHQSAGPPQAWRASLEAWQTAGWTLGICTSRHQHELDPPISALGWSDFFDGKHVITSTQVDEAQRLIGNGPLGKPHWFPLVASVAGVDTAIEMLLRQRRALPREDSPVAPNAVFIGDSSSDFHAAVGARQQGWAVDYVHLDGGLSSPELLVEIRNAAFCRGVVDDLPAAFDRLAEEPA